MTGGPAKTQPSAILDGPAELEKVLCGFAKLGNAGGNAFEGPK